jgi:tetratricopeptide (TPR) repeat protein
MAVLRPVKLTITNYPEGESELVEVENNPNDPEAGKRLVSFSREVYVEADDFLPEPVPKYKRLYPDGPECRLKGAYLIRCTGYRKDANGNIVEIFATYDPESRGGDPADGRKVKGATLHWVDANCCADAEVRLYSNLFADEDPEGDGKDYIGFAEIADEYSLTKSGNAANAYAAICNYKLGKYSEAIEFGKEFDGNGDINLSVVINGLIGDSYVNLNQYADAHKYFAKAYETNNEAFAALYLKKDGEVYEAEKNFDKAIELYNKIKNEFPQSGEAQDIEKYIERATLSK